MMSITMRVALGALVCTTLFAVCVPSASAQCQTCPSPVPTVAYQPVIAQPVVAQPAVIVQTDNRWYPGRLLDRMRLRRWNRWAGYRAATTTTAVPTTYAAFYQPTWAAATTSCVTCPQTTFRPVVLQPAASCCPAPVACYQPCASPCATVTSACSSCPSFGSSVSQATYQSPSDCASCTPSIGSSYPVSPTSPPTSTFETSEPQPAIAPGGVSPQQVQKQAIDNGVNGNGTNSQDADPTPGDDTSTRRLQPLQLFNPDPRHRTTNRGEARIWKAIYRQPVSPAAPTRRASQGSKSQAEVDAAGWQLAP